MNLLLSESIVQLFEAGVCWDEGVVDEPREQIDHKPVSRCDEL